MNLNSDSLNCGYEDEVSKRTMCVFGKFRKDIAQIGLFTFNSQYKNLRKSIQSYRNL
jgi:hypothetical protein